MTIIKGCHLSASGASTGTGSAQTIAHGLGAIPTSVRIFLATTGELMGASADATNIYPNVADGTAFTWIAEVW